jgi:hypothetical protein
VKKIQLFVAFFTLVYLAGSAAAADRDPPMLKTLPDSGYTASALFTVGDSIENYRPPGVLDGLAAFVHGEDSIRVLANHELSPTVGYPYSLANGTELTGARISYFDIEKSTLQIVAAGPAYDSVRDRAGKPVTDARQISELDVSDSRGLNTLCSANGYAAGQYGFVDDIYFTHEEVSAREDHPHGGSIWALDVQGRELWGLPELGRGSWENSTALATPDGEQPDGHVAILLGDDIEFGAAPLYLWVGKKQPDGNFIERNGLATGQLYVWLAGNGAKSPQDWRGTGNAVSGLFVELPSRDVERSGKRGYDPAGYLDDTTLRKSAAEQGAFMFSRPEDLHTDPADGTRAVLASTGQGRVFPTDDWGTLYVIAVNFGETDTGQPVIYARLTIIHDGDDFGDEGIRSPDNLVWAGDGMVYVQEDKATKLHNFGDKTGNEASVWRIDPDKPADYSRIAEIDRSVVLPGDASDKRSRSLGAWESSGIIDVSGLLDRPGGSALLLTVQAHSVRGGSLGGSGQLVQGGQIVLLEKNAEPTPD